VAVLASLVVARAVVGSAALRMEVWSHRRRGGQRHERAGCRKREVVSEKGLDAESS
jgi:hypothetical protein